MVLQGIVVIQGRKYRNSHNSVSFGGINKKETDLRSWTSRLSFISFPLFDWGTGTRSSMGFKMV